MFTLRKKTQLNVGWCLEIEVSFFIMSTEYTGFLKWSLIPEIEKL